MNRLIDGVIRVPFLALLLVMTSCASSDTATRAEESVSNSSGEQVALVTDLSASGEGSVAQVIVEADGPIPYTVFKLNDPPRLIIDMSQVDMSAFQSVIPVNSGPVNDVRPTYFAETIDSRIEIDLANDADYSIDDSSPDRLVVNLTGSGGSTMAANSAPATVEDISPIEEPTTDLMTISDDAGQYIQVTGVEYQKMGRMDRIIISTSSDSPMFALIARKQMNRLTIDLPETVINSGDERVLNVNLDDSMVKNIASFQFRGGQNPLTKVVVNLEEMALYNIVSEGNRVILDIGDEAVLAQASESDDPLGGDNSLASGGKQYTGARISLDFQKADIHNILRIIADYSGYNVITSGAVKGEVTMKLHDVPWDQALDVILKNNGLDKIQEGNIIRVATVNEIKKENEALQEKVVAEQNLAPLYTRIFEVNYESADKMKGNLESIKSTRGKIEINERTNALIVQDTKGKLAEMATLISKLDQQEKQVLIEARIVEITHNKAMELGIQWGGYYSGVTGTNFPNTVGVTGSLGAGPITPTAGGTGVNLPTSAAPFGGIGISLGHVNGTALLDAKLMALEQSGEGRVVSMPRITTMNNNEAIIEAGSDVPYQTTSAEGTKTEFKKAVLRLQVTPHVTPDNNVRMQIAVNKDTADFANATAAGPPIRTKQASTEVLVSDGETTVIGGLFQNTDQRTNRKVPLFGDIPLLGWLFQSRGTTRDSEELLIFITPKIVQ